MTVNFGESQATVEKTARERGYSFPILLDEKGYAMGAFRVFVRPATFIIEPDGKIKSFWVGLVPHEQWRAETGR